jgi:prepilin signal peptidase PulO-like enzyme (type II secretory pathway)
VNCQNFQRNALSHITCWLAMGFAAVLLIGPILAVVGFVLSLVVAVVSSALPFLVVGFLIWLPFQLSCQRKRRPSSAGRSVQVTPLHAACERTPVSRWEKLRWLVRPVGGIMLETACGAVLLGGLAVLIAHDMRPREREEYLVCGTIIGSVVGLLVGLANYLPATPSAADQCA